MRIAVTGYYGFMNFGDELFIIASKLAAERYWDEHQLLFVSPPIEGVAADFIVPRWFPRALYAQMGLAGKITRMVFLVMALLRTQAVLNAGGTTIASGSSDAKLKLQVLMRQWFAKPIFGIGLSIGPFDSIEERDAAKVLLLQFDGLSLRDRRSCQAASELIPEMDVACSTDLVSIVADEYRFDAISNASDVLGVALMRFEETFPDVNSRTIDIERAMTSIIEFAQRKNMQIRLFALNMHPDDRDSEAAETFMMMAQASQVECESITLENGPISVWEQIAGCTMMVSYRLHGAIAAYLSDIPFYLVEYHQKCTDFLDDIDYPEAYRTKQQKDPLPAFLEHLPRPARHHAEYIAQATSTLHSFKMAESMALRVRGSSRS